MFAPRQAVWQTKIRKKKLKYTNNKKCREAENKKYFREVPAFWNLWMKNVNEILLFR